MARLIFNFSLWLAVLVGFRGDAAESRNLSLAKTLASLGYEEVSLRRTDENRLFIFARVDGRKRSCLVDSGWSFTTISTNTAARLSDANLITRLKLGSVTFTNISVRAQDIRVNGQPASFDIVLGCDFLVANNAVLDFANRKLFLRRSALTTKEQMALDDLLSATKLIAVPLEIRQPPTPIVPARINGREIRLLVDSGAPWSCLDSTIAAQIGIKSSPSANQISGVVAPEKKSMRIASVDNVTLSDARLTTVNFAILSLSDWGFGPDGKLFTDVGGILGGAELFRASVVMDFRSKKLWLRTKS